MHSRSRLSAFRRAALALPLIATLVTAGCAGGHEFSGDSIETMAPITLRYGDYTTVSSAGPFRAFAAEVEEGTNGKVTFEEYWGGSLVKGAEMAQAVRGGVIDMGMFTPSYYPSEFPMTDWITKLGTMVEPEQPLGVLQAFAAGTEFSLNDPLVTEQFADKDIKLLFTWTPSTNYNLVCTEPVTNLEEARGKRVRAGGDFNTGELEALGMVPVTLPTGEIYEGLQRGVVDCSVANPKIMVSLGLWEVAKHYVDLPLTSYTQFVIMNKDVYDKLPEDAREVIDKARYTWFEGYLESEGIILNQRLITEGEGHGVTFHEAGPGLVDTLTGYQDNRIQNLGAVAPKDLEDPEEAIQRYRDLMAKWKNRFVERGYGDPEAARIPSDPTVLELDLTPFEQSVRPEIFGGHDQ